MKLTTVEACGFIIEEAYDVWTGLDFQRRSLVEI